MALPSDCISQANTSGEGSSIQCPSNMSTLPKQKNDDPSDFMPDGDGCSVFMPDGCHFVVCPFLFAGRVTLALARICIAIICFQSLFIQRAVSIKVSLLEFEEKTHITNQRWANSVLINTNTNVNIIRL